MISKTLSSTLLATALFLAAPLQAQVYSWTDAQGRQHYGDAASAPPSSAKLMSVHVAHAPVDQRQAPGPDQAQESPQDAAPEQTTPDEKSCQEATRNRDLLADEAKRVMKPGEDGAVEMSKDERAAALDRAKQQMKMYCTGS